MKRVFCLCCFCFFMWILSIFVEWNLCDFAWTSLACAQEIVWNVHWSFEPFCVANFWKSVLALSWCWTLFSVFIFKHRFSRALNAALLEAGFPFVVVFRNWYTVNRAMCLLLLALQIALGTVTNVQEAVQWLSYTYFYVRMLLNPLAYGIPYSAKEVSTSVSVNTNSCSD